MSERERFDGILLSVAQQAGSIENILDVYFDFLLRKTDFFTGAQAEDAPRKLVLNAFEKHWKMAEKTRKDVAAKNKAEDDVKKKKLAKQAAKDKAEFETKQAEISKKFEEVDDDEAERIKAEAAEKKAMRDRPYHEKTEDERKKEEEEDDKEPPPEGNGGVTDRYTWTQTLGALEITIPIKPGTKARQVVCEMGVETLKVGIKGETLLVTGKMHAKVKPDDSMWTLVDGKAVQISLEKLDQMKWWSCVMEGDSEINTRKIVPENSKLGDLDGETRQTVEKMMFDQRQKAAGKPTSDQQKQHDLLEKFKSAHPEMDFSKANVNYGGGGGGGGGFSMGQ